MNKKDREELDVRFKIVVLDFADAFGVTKTCREFNVARSTFYRWRQKYDKEGRFGLYRKKPIAYNHPCKISHEIIDKILEIRQEYQIGALRIKYYLERYHGIQISESTISRALKTYGVNKLPKTAPKRAVHSKRYAKKVPGHHIQVDVKFLWLKNSVG